METETPGSPDLRLTKALLIYEGGSDCAITQHEFKEGHIQPGHPIEKHALMELLNKRDSNPAAKIELSLDWVHHNLLAENSMFRMWWTPPQYRILFFKEEDRKTKSRKVWMPGLVWLGGKNRNVLSIFAVAGDGRPTKDTTVYRPAYTNIYGDCNVCIGSMNTGRRTIADWERGFYDSSFSGPAHLTTKPYAVQKKFKKAGRLGQAIAQRVEARGGAAD